jgi:Holliday junction resolvasome RuvABC endonuclease subunit
MTREYGSLVGKVIVGVDIGFTRENPSALAWIEFTATGPVLQTHNLASPMYRGGAWTVAVDEVLDRLTVYLSNPRRPYDAIAYEMPHVQNNAAVAIKLAHVCGGVRLIAIANQRPSAAVQPAEAKKALTRSGAATKAEMQGAAYKLFGARLTPHEADACGVALAGAVLLGWTKELEAHDV